MTYDSRCADLADVFLAESPDINNPKSRDKLAAAIQQVIEDFIEYNEGKCELCGEARGKDVHKDCIWF
jgi:hypothetical protein